MNKNIFEIFKYTVYCKIIKFNLNELNNFCFKLQNKDKGRVISNVGGWQSNNILNEYPIIDLKKLISKHVNTYAKEFKLKKELKINNLWININGYKDSNMVHFHPMSIISGVFYVKVPKNSGNLNFHNPTEDLMSGIIDNNISEYNKHNSSTWSFTPQENLLFLFPSYYKHSVAPNMSKEKRISISFNSDII
tara:strand:+ start:1024 stop:1599 length:576 start_codon:yes stop_codon:yes gene_type:complete